MKKKSLLLAIIMVFSSLSGCKTKEEPAKIILPSTEEVLAENATEPILGGWNVNDASSTIPERAQQAFDKAFDGFAGAGYEPIAYLGSQVVAGTNYAFLCKGTIVTANPYTKLVVVIIYNDLQGNAKVLSINDLIVKQ